MAARAVICLANAEAADALSMQLGSAGFDTVLRPDVASFVDDVKQGADVLVVQQAYDTATGLSLLRKVRVAMGDAVPAVMLETSGLSTADRHVLAKQYEVRSILPDSATPAAIADAVQGAVQGASSVQLDPLPLEDEDDGLLSLPGDDDLLDFSALGDGLEPEGLDEFDFLGDDPVEEPDPFLSPTIQTTAYEPESVPEPVDAGPDPVKEAEAARDDAERELEAVRAERDRLRSELSEQGAAQSTAQSENAADKATIARLEAEMEAMRTALQVAESAARASNEAAEGNAVDQKAMDRLEAEMQAMRTAVQVAESAAQASKTEAEELHRTIDTLKTEFSAAQEAVAAGDAGAQVALKSAQDQAASETRRADGLAADLEAARAEASAASAAKTALEAQLVEAQDALDAAIAAQDAPDLDPEQLPTEGVLEDIRYAQLLKLCRQARFEGAIEFHVATGTRHVYFKAGAPVAFSSNEPGERIGKVLVNQGRITTEQYNRAATLIVERGLKLSDALVELGVIDHDTLASETRNLTREQIIGGFAMTEGRFKLVTDRSPSDAAQAFEFGPGEIYVQGFKRHAPAGEMAGLYESRRQSYLRAAENLPELRPQLSLDADDERLLRLLGQALTLDEAVERAGLTEDQGARLVAALDALDALETWSPGIEAFMARLGEEKQRYLTDTAALKEEFAERERTLTAQLSEGLARMDALADGLARLEGLGEAVGRLEERLADTTLTTLPTPAQSAAIENELGGHAETVVAPSAGAEPEPAAHDAPSVQVAPELQAQPSEPSVQVAPETTVDTPESYAEMGEPTAAATVIDPPAEPVAFADAELGHPPRDDADRAYLEGLAFARDGTFDEAEKRLRATVRLDATRPLYLWLLARVLLANPKYEREGTLPVVRSLLDRAVQLAPDNTRVCHMHEEIVAEMEA